MKKLNKPIYFESGFENFKIDKLNSDFELNFENSRIKLKNKQSKRFLLKKDSQIDCLFLFETKLFNTFAPLI